MKFGLNHQIEVFIILSIRVYSDVLFDLVFTLWLIWMKDVISRKIATPIRSNFR